MNIVEKNEALAQTPPETLDYYARFDEILAMGELRFPTLSYKSKV